MALNNINTAIPDKVLTDILAKDLVYNQYICEQILPTKKLTTNDPLTGTFYKLSNSDFDIEGETRVANGDAYPRVKDFDRTKDTYTIEDHGLSTVITRIDRANVGDPFNLRSERSLLTGSKLWLQKEKELADKLRDVNNYGSDNKITLSTTDQFSDQVNSTPLDVLADAIDRLKLSAGAIPSMVLPPQVFTQLQTHPQLMDRLGYKYNRVGRLTEDDLARAFGVTKVYDASAVGNTNKAGIARSDQFIWGKDIVLVVAPDSISKIQTSLGYLFQWGTPRSVFTSKLQEPVDAELIQISDAYQFKLFNWNAAYLIKDAVA